jgi:hypothetical protein
MLFHHPSYDDLNNVLLKLFAPDLGQNSTGRGLYAQYTLEACGIIAGIAGKVLFPFTSATERH